MQNKILSISILLTLTTIANADNANFVNNPVAEAIQVADVVTISAFTIQGATQIPIDQLQQQLADAKGRALTLSEIKQYANKITEFYNAKGYPLAVAVLPPQQIENGVVTIEVIEGVLSEIQLNNASRVDDKTVLGLLSYAKAGNTLNNEQAERALSLVQDLAGTGKVGYQLAAAEQVGASVMTVDVGSAALIDGSVGVDNFGSKSTGEARLRANVNINSPFGYGERFSLAAMSSFEGIHNGSLAAELPLGARGLKLFGNVAHTRYDLGGEFKDLNATGTSTTASLGASYPLIRSNRHNLWLEGNVQYGDVQDKIGATGTLTDKTKRALMLSVRGNHYDDTLAGGYTQYNLSNIFGQLAIDSADAKAIDAASARTDGNFYKLTANISRTQFINSQWTAFAGLTAQLSNKNLDSSEQMSIGGIGGVAAYHPNDVSADNGLLGQLELRYRINPHLTAAGFYQGAAYRLRHNPYTNTKNTDNLHGAGIGLYANYNDFNLETKVAWRLGDNTFSNNNNPRFWLRASYEF